MSVWRQNRGWFWLSCTAITLMKISNFAGEVKVLTSVLVGIISKSQRIKCWVPRQTCWRVELDFKQVEVRGVLRTSTKSASSGTCHLTQRLIYPLCVPGTAPFTNT